MRQLIKTDGTVTDLPAPLTMSEIRSLIQAPMGLDHVTLHHMGRPRHVMLCDDDAYEIKTRFSNGVTELVPVAGRRPVNEKATELYHRNCIAGTTHQILGDVVVVPDGDFA